jgi:C4-dicarboxylate-specific signal transduction histidine kinase
VAERMPLDVTPILREVASLMEPQASRNEVTIDLELAHDLPPVLGDRVQLQQVVANLILNGIEAMHELPTGRGGL